MAHYTYRCEDNHEHRQDEVHGMNENPAIKCKICGSDTKKVIGKNVFINTDFPGSYNRDQKMNPGFDSKRDFG